jgi:hypothetical protein
VHGPTCIFWANLTPFCAQPGYVMEVEATGLFGVESLKEEMADGAPAR